jgi:hypothetical protein
MVCGEGARFFSLSRFSFALYATGRRESAIFVGLWAPTILNLGQSLLEEDLSPHSSPGLASRTGRGYAIHSPRLVETEF